MLECRPFSPRAIVADLPTELLGPFMVELKAAPVLMDDGTVVAPRRFERHVTGTHIGEDSFGIGLFASVASMGELCVSPSLSATVALTPSSSNFAPHPPPGWPM